MQLTPISRDSMRLLKSETDKENHINRLNEIIEYIYNGAVNTAKTSNKTSYYYSTYRKDESEEFYMVNMFEIISTLQSLFPECSVRNTPMIIGRDGSLQDMSKMDKMFINFYIRNNYDNRMHEYIVIDWSKE
jgi:hypothetical protein